MLNENRGEEKRKEILKSIISYIQEHGYSPTIREIGKMVNLRSTSTVSGHLEKMLREGMIETDADIGSPRAIRVPEYEFVKKK